MAGTMLQEDEKSRPKGKIAVPDSLNIKMPASDSTNARLPRPALAPSDSTSAPKDKKTIPAVPEKNENQKEKKPGKFHDNRMFYIPRPNYTQNTPQDGKGIKLATGNKKSAKEEKEKS